MSNRKIRSRCKIRPIHQVPSIFLIFNLKFQVESWIFKLKGYRNDRRWCNSSWSIPKPKRILFLKLCNFHWFHWNFQSKEWCKQPELVHWLIFSEISVKFPGKFKLKSTLELPNGTIRSSNSIQTIRSDSNEIGCVCYSWKAEEIPKIWLKESTFPISISLEMLVGGLSTFSTWKNFSSWKNRVETNLFRHWVDNQEGKKKQTNPFELHNGNGT